MAKLEEIEKRIEERIAWLIVLRDEAEKAENWQKVAEIEEEIINLKRILG